MIISSNKSDVKDLESIRIKGSIFRICGIKSSLFLGIRSSIRSGLLDINLDVFNNYTSYRFRIDSIST